MLVAVEIVQAVIIIIIIIMMMTMINGSDNSETRAQVK